MGAAGDMLTAALFELSDNKKAFLKRMNSLGLNGVEVEAETSVKCGITGTHMSVKVGGDEEDSHHHHHDHTDHSHSHEGEHDHSHGDIHSGMDEISHLISHLPVSDKVKNDVKAIYSLIAEAESHVHGKPVNQIHFHEVGTLDALADITGVCMLMEELSPDEVIVSPVHVGSGQVKCAHGVLPVPAPATAYILRYVPIYGGSVKGELCTPTGAAILKHFASKFSSMPIMTVSKIGYGMGKKDFKAANCVRAMIGITGNIPAGGDEAGEGKDEVVELACNLDDMTPEAIGFAQEILLASGALDVYTIPIGMKKSRPAVMLCCICKRDMAEETAKLMLRHTTTLGVREAVYQRYTLNREAKTVDTEFGQVRVKKSSGWGVEKSKPEYEDLAKIARENGISIADTEKLI